MDISNKPSTQIPFTTQNHLTTEKETTQTTIPSTNTSIPQDNEPIKQITERKAGDLSQHKVIETLTCLEKTSILSSEEILKHIAFIQEIKNNPLQFSKFKLAQQALINLRLTQFYLGCYKNKQGQIFPQEADKGKAFILLQEIKGNPEQFNKASIVGQAFINFHLAQFYFGDYNESNFSQEIDNEQAFTLLQEIKNNPLQFSKFKLTQQALIKIRLTKFYLGCYKNKQGQIFPQEADKEKAFILLQEIKDNPAQFNALYINDHAFINFHLSEFYLGSYKNKQGQIFPNKPNKSQALRLLQETKNNQTQFSTLHAGQKAFINVHLAACYLGCHKSIAQETNKEKAFILLQEIKNDPTQFSKLNINYQTFVSFQLTKFYLGFYKNQQGQLIPNKPDKNQAFRLLQETKNNQAQFKELRIEEQTFINFHLAQFYFGYYNGSNFSQEIDHEQAFILLQEIKDNPKQFNTLYMDDQANINFHLSEFYLGCYKNKQGQSIPQKTDKERAFILLQTIKNNYPLHTEQKAFTNFHLATCYLGCHKFSAQEINIEKAFILLQEIKNDLTQFRKLQINHQAFVSLQLAKFHLGFHKNKQGQIIPNNPDKNQAFRLLQETKNNQTQFSTLHAGQKAFINFHLARFHLGNLDNSEWQMMPQAQNKEEAFTLLQEIKNNLAQLNTMEAKDKAILHFELAQLHLGINKKHNEQPIPHALNTEQAFIVLQEIKSDIQQFSSIPPGGQAIVNIELAQIHLGRFPNTSPNLLSTEKAFELLQETKNNQQAFNQLYPSNQEVLNLELAQLQAKKNPQASVEAPPQQNNKRRNETLQETVAAINLMELAQGAQEKRQRSI